jgi:hypothetical protein
MRQTCHKHGMDGISFVSAVSRFRAACPRTGSCRALLAVSASAGILAAALSAPARANDSEAEWALGGLVLKQNDAISMDKEDLYISATEVKVDYTYTNHSDADQTVLVSFPLPALPGNVDFVEFGAFPDWQALDFHTTVEGKAVDWQVAQRAMVGERDVTAEVAKRGWPLQWYQDESFIETVSALPAD